jgi:hypothetical protein
MGKITKNFIRFAKSCWDLKIEIYQFIRKSFLDINIPSGLIALIG